MASSTVLSTCHAHHSPQQLAEEQLRDKEALRLAGERYRRERQLQRKEADEARERKKAAYLK